MKYFVVILFALFSIPSFAQLWQKNFPVENTLYLGTSVNSDVSSNVFTQFESRSDWVKIQLTYLTDFRFRENRINAKFGIRTLNWRKEDLGLWIYMPYLNMNLNEGGRYNSPFSFELQWQKKFAVVLDTGFKDVNVQVRYRTKIFRKKTSY